MLCLADACQHRQQIKKHWIVENNGFSITIFGTARADVFIFLGEKQQ